MENFTSRVRGGQRGMQNHANAHVNAMYRVRRQAPRIPRQALVGLSDIETEDHVR